ncbi:MAG: hypothetical protein KDK41_05485 [Leptospiraceae bacterium]|nr:hypothetical protein [Leptospiraceae bacterium]MCB1200077.1 hypothetical protein [Leptospiraceae bacterium]
MNTVHEKTERLSSYLDLLENQNRQLELTIEECREKRLRRQQSYQKHVPVEYKSEPVQYEQETVADFHDIRHDLDSAISQLDSFRIARTRLENLLVT